MGINRNGLKFLTYAFNRGVSFESTLMLGRQNFFVGPSTAVDLLKRFNVRPLAVQHLKPGSYSEPLFEDLGATLVDSMDYSPFESATQIHDLNEPVPFALHEKYSVVFDGGTLEHVFDFPIAIRNCMEMVKQGGHFLAVTPANNFCGHGFYQFSPELYYSLFTEASGFEVQLIAVTIEDDKKDTSWYRVSKPSDVKMRATLINRFPTTMMVIAQKTGPIASDLKPQQSDYRHAWSQTETSQSNSLSQGETPMRQRYRRWIPSSVRDVVWKLMHRTKDIEDLGRTAPGSYSKMDI
jgi:hypothetical protein